MSKRIVVMPDIQAPYEDRRIVRAFIRFIGAYQPDELLCIGDLVDFPQPSRWSKDTRGEFEGSVFKDAEYVRSRILSPIREVYSGRFTFIEGNHDERPRVYLAKYAPALVGTKAFDIDVLLGFDQLDIDWVDEFYDVAPGWVATHGHRGGIRLTSTGSTALNAAKRIGKSVVMGHTHRLALTSYSTGYAGKVVNQLFGMEVGHMMNHQHASRQYLKGGTANWQTGFGILHVTGRHVRPEIVPVTCGQFTVEGEVYQS